MPKFVSNNKNILLDSSLNPNAVASGLLTTTTHLLDAITYLSPTRHTFGIIILLSLQSTTNISEDCLPSYFSVVKWFYTFADKDQFIIAHKEGFILLKNNY